MNKFHTSIILTHRCNSRCNSCNIWKNPTKYSDEVKASDLDKLPNMFFTNVAGGELFLRKDLDEVFDVLIKKSKRIVISTNGYLTERIIKFAEKHPSLGFRISLDGLSQNHNMLRGRNYAFDNALKTLLSLKELGRKDIGFSMTIQDSNIEDALDIFRLCKQLNVEFATGVIQNAYFFQKHDNTISYPVKIIECLDLLVNELLQSHKPKNWIRAYYNEGLKDVALGLPRRIKCNMASDGGFVTDPQGNVLPCNVLEQFLPLGNLKHQSWDEIWNGPQALKVRESICNCHKNCWSIGNVAPDIWRNPIIPIKWLLNKKFMPNLTKT